MNFKDEFKNFILKGNVVDLAVAVVIGTAFKSIVDALVAGVIMPLVSYVLPSGDWQTWTLGKLQLGQVLGAVVNFLIIALVVFLVFVKALGRLVHQREEMVLADKPRTCPDCCEPVALAARRCPHCTSALA